jgi:hypothetical protein
MEKYAVTDFRRTLSSFFVFVVPEFLLKIWVFELWTAEERKKCLSFGAWVFGSIVLWEDIKHITGELPFVAMSKRLARYKANRILDKVF